MKKFAYFPGCSLKTTGIEFDLSVKAVAQKLDIELWEIPDWNCCGSSSAHLTNPYLALGLAARNLAIAEEAGLDVAIPCAACYARSKQAELAAREDAEKRALINEIIARNYQGENHAYSILEIFADQDAAEAIREKVISPLTGMKAAAYYGCLLVRPKETACDDSENPTKMDRLLEALGAEAIDWNGKTDCCGASHSAAAEPAVGLAVIDRILCKAQESGANCIVTACPMCMANLDMRQKECAQKFGREYQLPIYYFTELMGLAFGIDGKAMGIDRHFVSATALPTAKEGAQA